MYQPTLGRFLSRDPVASDGVDVLDDNNRFGHSLDRMRNQYMYCDGNPMTRVDPSGNRWETWITPNQLEEQAERRRGSGGLGDTSAHHCWFVCEASLRITTGAGLFPGAGIVDIAAPLKGAAVAVIIDLVEVSGWGSDSWQDIAANHRGAGCANAIRILGRWIFDCDSCCGTVRK